MDLNNLPNASTYLNSLLLARGLLRNGKPIEFARPKNAAGGSQETMANIINLVHDLVTRRDRDAEQREQLGTTVRDLRVEEARQTAEADRVKNKNDELSRSLATAEAHQRTLEASFRRAEASARELKEQMAKMKSTLDQVRAKCINDVRKRDMELEKLKKHVAGMQRGSTQSGGIKILQLNPQPQLPKNAREFRGNISTEDENWSLEKESSDFLTALVNETSTENTTLRHVIAQTIETLKELTDLDQLPEDGPDSPEIGIPGQYKKSRVTVNAKQQQEGLVPCEDLSTQMETVLGHCRAILKDPSFVSIDEVQIREDEIIRLREGWERMTSQWKRAMGMMDAWRKQMMNGGPSIDLDQLGTFDLEKHSTRPSIDEVEDSTGGQAKVSPLDQIFERPQAWTRSSKDHEDKEVENGGGQDGPQPPPPKRLASSPAKRGVRLQKPIAAA